MQIVGMRPRSQILLTAVFLLASSVASVAHAQRDSSRGSVCLRPQPAPRCRVIVVTEVGVEYPVYSSGTTYSTGFQAHDFETRLVFGGGLLINRGPRYAFGAVVGVDNRDPRGIAASRLDLRYRRWNGRTMYDFSVGPARRASHSQVGTSAGLTAAAGIDVRYVAVDLRADVIRSGGQTQRALFAGGKATGLAAPIAVAAGVIFMIAIMAGSAGSG